MYSSREWNFCNSVSVRSLCYSDLHTLKPSRWVSFARILSYELTVKRFFGPWQLRLLPLTWSWSLIVPLLLRARGTGCLSYTQTWIFLKGKLLAAHEHDVWDSMLLYSSGQFKQIKKILSSTFGSSFYFKFGQLIFRKKNQFGLWM